MDTTDTSGWIELIVKFMVSLPAVVYSLTRITRQCIVVTDRHLEVLRQTLGLSRLRHGLDTLTRDAPKLPERDIRIMAAINYGRKVRKAGEIEGMGGPAPC